VLVVDDDRETLGLLATFLGLEGFDVTTAADATEALQVAGNGFDVITTDLAMPRMDGGELIARIQSLPITPIPIVILTAQLVSRSQAELVPSCHILTKPCELDRLAGTIRSLLATCSHDGFRCSTCPMHRSPWRPSDYPV
jgi:two-component system, OmpR family, phosphate regulon response regulator OmpR